MAKNGVKNKDRPQNKNLIPHKKGENGGAHRPKGQKNYSTLRKEAIIKVAKKNGKTPQEIEVLLHANAISRALKGDYRFYKDDIDRIHGAPNEHLDITSGGEAIEGSLSAEAIRQAEIILKKKKTRGEE